MSTGNAVRCSALSRSLMLLVLVAGTACSSRVHTASGAGDGGVRPDDHSTRLDEVDPASPPATAAVDASSNVTCEVVPDSDLPPIVITTRGPDGRPWIGVGPDVSVHEAGVVTALEALKLSVMLPTTGRALDVEGTDFGAHAIAVGDSVGIVLQSTGGRFESGAQFLVVRSSLEGPALFAWYGGDKGLLGGAFSGALGIDIEVGSEVLCSYVPEFTCFDGQRTSILQLTLSADEPLALGSGEHGQLFIDGQRYDVVVSATRTDDGPSERCFDAIFGDFFGLALTRR